MDYEKIRGIIKPVVRENLVGLLGISLSKDFLWAFASDKNGILPHDIPNGSFLFIDKNAEYKKGDYIFIRDERLNKENYRIVKAVDDKEECLGKLMLSIKLF